MHMTMFSEMTNRVEPQIKSIPARIQAVLSAYASRRGFRPPELDNYLWPRIDLLDRKLPGIEMSVGLVLDALKKKESILIYGDYDCDGITSTALLLNFFRDCLGLQPRWKLPNRQKDHYGLTPAKAAELIASNKPHLLIALDCGTNSDEALAIFREVGVKTLVIDHHPPAGRPARPTVMVNPKANADHCNDAEELCTCSLVLLFCAALAKTSATTDHWDSEFAVAIAALATLADACKLTPLNRALVKTGLPHFNSSQFLSKYPGLAALLCEANVDHVNQSTAQFQLIPRLNALGRLGSPEPGVELLLTRDSTQAKRIASLASGMNRLRQDTQERIVRSAIEQARRTLERQPSRQLLLLADPHWHAGVVGPAASRVVEQCDRSAILLAPDSSGLWRGSGRSRRGEDLGRLVRALKQTGKIMSGGGHPAAVGLTLTDHQLRELQKAQNLLIPASTTCEVDSEYIGDASDLRLEEWVIVMDLLGPFGVGNPWPVVRAGHCRLSEGPVELRTKAGHAWAIKAEFRTDSGSRIDVLQRNAFSFRQPTWRRGGVYNLELELSSSAKAGTTFHNWVCRMSTRERNNAETKGT
jgi:single-stranded-DNA-specific exonuclease